jgi:hypothetical protein
MSPENEGRAFMGGASSTESCLPNGAGIAPNAQAAAHRDAEAKQTTFQPQMNNALVSNLNVTFHGFAK